MFRRWPTILSEEVDEGEDAMAIAALDSDVIMTAAVLGFTAGRLAVGHPVQFTVDPLDGQPKLDALRASVRRINAALGENLRGGAATGEFAPPWSKGSVITGAAGASNTPFAQRRVTDGDLDELSVELRKVASAEGVDSIGYQGVGAYTGFVADPLGKPAIMSTKRYNVPRNGYGDRWSPPEYSYADINTKELVRAEDDRAWGLILGLDDLDRDMVQEPYHLAPGGNVVGYTHGMIQAIYSAVQKGPWATPFEIAVGKKTKKLASCFTCSLFMYAAGFPPSAIHLGKGESWVPFYEIGPDEPGHHAAFHAVSSSLNNRWRIECRQHLMLGVAIMKKSGMASVTGDHRPRLALLDEFLTEKANDFFVGANLILDAVTISDGETNRIDRTLVLPV